MIRFQIPSNLLPAFRSLAGISDEQINQLVKFLSELPLGLGPKSFRTHFKEKVNQEDKYAPEIGPLLFSLGGFKETDDNTLVEQIARTGITEQSIPEITLQGKPVESDHTIPAQSEQPFIDQSFSSLLAA